MPEDRTRPTRLRPAPADTEITGLSGIDPVLRRLYETRGVSDANELNYALQSLLPVSSMSGIDAAVALLLQHTNNRIMIIGDFDADGATSTALVMRCLKEFGINDVDYLVPNRFKFGYGLTPEIVRVAAESSPDLLITVDNGVSSIDGVLEAHSLGIKVLITDHHLPGAELPAADAMVNPNLADNDFASSNLAGVGVAFYLMAALGRELQAAGREGAARVPTKYLDLVALGTVADVVPLDHNNRILVSQGLLRIRAGKSVCGIQALLQLAGRSASRIVSTDLGFVVGPRLNAAGRLEDMSVGIECLLTDSRDAAARLASALDEINRNRKNIETKMREEAFSAVDAIEKRDLPSCICVYDPKWHQGVVGLIAARVRERWNRPVIAFATEGNGQLKGSARSIPGVHVRDLLEAVSSAKPGLVGKFGGHAMAAGLTIRETDLPQFTLALQSELAGHPELQDPDSVCYTDGPLFGEELCIETAEVLRTGSPWGAGFPEPLFDDEFVVVERRWIKDKHLKLVLATDVRAKRVDAIAFNVADRPAPPKRQRVRVVYRLEVDDYRPHHPRPQLVVEHIEAILS